MPSLLDSPPQIPAAAGAWGSLYDVQEPVKPRHVMVVPAAAASKKPAAYGARKKNLETCTEGLGCETGAFDAALPACNVSEDMGDDGEVEEAAECAERKRRAREEEMEMEGRARQSARRPLPPPLTTLARRARMVHEQRDGRLVVYAVRTPWLEAERSGGRLRMRLISSLPSGGSPTACRRQEAQEAEAAKEEVVVVEEGECGVAKFVRGGRCVEPEGAAAAARHGKQWEQEQMQAAAFWVATS